MRKLPTEKRAAILSALTEGASIRATARMVGVSKLTVLRLLADAGSFCRDFHNLTVRDLKTTRVEMDEAWGFCGAKEKARRHGANGYGDVWTWVAQDACSKLVIAYHVGKRDEGDAFGFVEDVASRLPERVQITTDGFGLYPGAIEGAFGERVDYAQIVKKYAGGSVTDRGPEARYSPPACIGVEKHVIHGDPDVSLVSTSYIERQNRDLRMRCRRMTRLTDAFSKRVENHAHAVALHYFAFNFVKRHASVKTTPAVAAGIASAPLTMFDLAQMIEREEKALRARLSDYQPARKSR